MPPFFESVESEAQSLTIFFAEWCGTCARVVPILSSKAERAGFIVQLVDVDDPRNRDSISHIGYVPFIEFEGSEISIEECLRLLAERFEHEDE